MFIINIKKQFDNSALYPRGTLLFRCYDPYTQGHIAMVYTDKAKYKDAKVFHTIGDPVGENKVAIELLSYYTHVLLPEDYIDTECFSVPT